MARRAAVRHFAIALFSLLALAPLADAQTTPSLNAANSGAGTERLIYGVDAGLGETDNVSLAPTNKVSQTIATIDADFDIKHQSSRLDVDAKGNFTDFDYLQGAFGNQLLGRFDGVAHFALIPQRLTWVLSDDFGQAALDPFAPTTPGNLEDINYVSTGPDLALRVGGTGFVDASLRMARATFQTSPFNSSRVLGTIAAGLQLSARSTVSLNGAAERVLFDNTVVNGDFNRTSAYARYEIQGARTELSVDLGATKISQNASSGTSTVVLIGGVPTIVPVTIPQSAYSTTGPLARIAVTRKLSSAASLSLSGGRELTDGTSSFGTIQSGAIGIVGSVPPLLTSSSYTSDFGSVAWRYERNRTTIGVSGRWERDVYVSQPQFDLTRTGGEFYVERKLSRAFALQVLGRYYRNNYPNVDASLVVLDGGTPKYDDEVVGAMLSWRHGRVLELRLRAEHSSRTTPGADLGYGENRVFLTVGYRPQASNDSLEPSDTTTPGSQR
ncbi:MAG TPA: hypothetical protein VFG04_27035 [Planctomycetaceae bacterium]|nr:hypothetical protein [Planctomycetaceae bacterium]